MKRELTSVQRHMYGTALVYPFYRLSTREQVVLLDQLIMAVETLALGSRQKAHAARCDRGLRDGDPGGQRIRRLEPVICRILMPGDERFVSWLLLEEARAPAQDYRDRSDPQPRRATSDGIRDRRGTETAGVP